VLSIVIPTLNEEKYLPRLLQSLDCQTIKDFEIIVADANSRDATRQVAAEHGCRIVAGGRIPWLGSKRYSLARGTVRFLRAVRS
jgi:glycosyltransferase involved in cell wall biosynthesis